MSDPCAELQVAMVATLKADPALGLLFGAGKSVRVYDVPPVNASDAGPYITVGDDSAVEDVAEGIDGSEVSATVHVWSRTNPPGRTQAKMIAEAAQGALLALGDLPSHRVVNAERKLVRYLVEDDGTAHAVLTVQFNTEPLT